MSTLSRRNRILVACVLALIFLTGCIAGRLSADQPHMQAALEHLRLAKGELERAEEDKGGHRVRAIRLVNDAIVQVEKGMEHAEEHH
jgi:hypothetical protein